MTNHVHLLMTPESEWSISQVMQPVGWCYVRRVSPLGHLVEGLFKASIVKSGRYLLADYRYVELIR